MAMLCAPVSDERLAERREMQEVVAVFRGIMDLLEQMKLDVANLTITQVRPVFVSQSVDYEKLEFSEFLAGREDGLATTREWLVRHRPSSEEVADPKYRRLLGQRVLTEALAELLEWDDYHPMPETLVGAPAELLQLASKLSSFAVFWAKLVMFTPF